MTEAEKLVRKAGATQLPGTKHKIYVLKGHRFTLHHGTKPNHQEIYRVKRELRRLLEAS